MHSGFFRDIRVSQTSVYLFSFVVIVVFLVCGLYSKEYSVWGCMLGVPLFRGSPYLWKLPNF